jgi:hypothetical protein
MDIAFEAFGTIGLTRSANNTGQEPQTSPLSP